MKKLSRMKRILWLMLAAILLLGIPSYATQSPEIPPALDSGNEQLGLPFPEEEVAPTPTPQPPNQTSITIQYVNLEDGSTVASTQSIAVMVGEAFNVSNAVNLSISGMERVEVQGAVSGTAGSHPISVTVYYKPAKAAQAPAPQPTEPNAPSPVNPPAQEVPATAETQPEKAAQETIAADAQVPLMEDAPVPNAAVQDTLEIPPTQETTSQPAQEALASTNTAATPPVTESLSLADAALISMSAVSAIGLGGWIAVDLKVLLWYRQMKRKHLNS